MLVVGLQGSPRRRGNTHHLVSTFLSEAGRLGAETRLLEVDRMQVVPCKEYVVCEKHGYCPIEDEVKTEIYPLLREADLVVVGTPVFFYNMTAQLKAVIDRCQVFWARKYRHGLRDPKHRAKQGILLSVAATRGKRLFDAIELTVKNFFDAVDVAFVDRLTYREIEGPRDMRSHPTVAADVRQLAEKWIPPLLARRRLLFVDRTGSGAAQMAAAFAEDRFGDRVAARCAGTEPLGAVDPGVVDTMAAVGLDLAFRTPRRLTDVLEGFSPDVCVVVGEAEISLPGGGVEIIRWPLPAGAGAEVLRDDILMRVGRLLGDADG